MRMATDRNSANASSSFLYFSPPRLHERITLIPSRYSCDCSSAFNFEAICFENNLFCIFRLIQKIIPASGSIANIEIAIRQSKKARHIKTKLDDAKLARSCGTILEVAVSMFVQSVIILDDNSLKSLALKKLIGSFLIFSATRSLFASD